MNTYVSDLLSSSLTPPGNLTGKRCAEPALLPQASPLPGSLGSPPGPGSPLQQCSLLLHQWMPPEAHAGAAATWWGSLSALRAQSGVANLAEGMESSRSRGVGIEASKPGGLVHGSPSMRGY